MAIYGPTQVFKRELLSSVSSSDGTLTSASAAPHCGVGMGVGVGEMGLVDSLAQSAAVSLTEKENSALTTRCVCSRAARESASARHTESAPIGEIQSGR